jgi:hypothetical protein
MIEIGKVINFKHIYYNWYYLHVCDHYYQEKIAELLGIELELLLNTVLLYNGNLQGEWGIFFQDREMAEGCIKHLEPYMILAQLCGDGEVIC